MRLLFHAVLGFAFATSLVGVAHAEVRYFHANLTGARQFSPIVTTATGRADITLDTKSKALAWSVRWKNLSSNVIAAHIRATATSRVTINLVCGDIHNPLAGSAKVTNREIAALLAGKAYVDVETVDHRRGAIRGRLVSGM